MAQAVLADVQPLDFGDELAAEFRRSKDYLPGLGIRGILPRCTRRGEHLAQERDGREGLVVVLLLAVQPPLEQAFDAVHDGGRVGKIEGDVEMGIHRLWHRGRVVKLGSTHRWLKGSWSVEPQGKGLSLPVRIAIGLAVGVVLGFAARAVLAGTPDGARQLDWIVDNLAKPLGGIFLNMMFMMIIPLVFSSLALGVAGLGDIKAVGKLGARVLGGTIILTGAGVAVGLILVNAVRPGDGIPADVRDTLMAQTTSEGVSKNLQRASEAKSLAQTAIDSVSRNPIEDMANLFNPNPSYKGGGIIAFLVFTVIIGAALTQIAPAQATPIVALLEGIQALSMRVIGYAMWFAPIGVAALIFQTTAKVGTDLFGVLFKYMAVVLAGLLFHIAVTYSLVLRFMAGWNPMDWFMRVQEVIVTAFSTSSSNATLPTTLRVAEERLGLPKSISSFVLTVGSTANQNGTALFEGVTVLFLAQFYGIELGAEQQFTIVLMSIMAGIGTAGVPGGSIPLIAILLTTIGVPAEGIGIILGVDRLLDMSRTVANVLGDMVLATVASGPVPPAGG